MPVGYVFIEPSVFIGEKGRWKSGLVVASHVTPPPRLRHPILPSPDDFGVGRRLRRNEERRKTALSNPGLSLVRRRPIAVSRVAGRRPKQNGVPTKLGSRPTATGRCRGPSPLLPASDWLTGLPKRWKTR